MRPSDAPAETAHQTSSCVYAKSQRARGSEMKLLGHREDLTAAEDAAALERKYGEIFIAMTNIDFYILISIV